MAWWSDSRNKSANNSFNDNNMSINKNRNNSGSTRRNNNDSNDNPNVAGNSASDLLLPRDGSDVVANQQDPGIVGGGNKNPNNNNNNNVNGKFQTCVIVLITLCLVFSIYASFMSTFVFYQLYVDCNICHHCNNCNSDNYDTPTKYPTTVKPTVTPTLEPAAKPTMPSFPVIGDYKLSAQTQDHNGWLRCDGTLASSDTCPQLFKVIGYSFGNESKFPNNINHNFFLPNVSDSL